MKRLFIIFIVVTIAKHGLAQNVGIGTTSPVARLHVADSNVLFSGGPLWHLPLPAGPVPVQGGGVRMFWYPGKAAFRAGAVSGVLWDKDSIGRYSFVAGLDSKAKGDYSASLGVNNSSEGMGSFSAGVSNSALATYSISLGYNNVVRNTSGVVIGSDLISKSLYAVSLGAFNDTADAATPVGSSTSDDRIFQVGNGNAFTRSNAITVLRSGNTGIGTLLPKARLHVDSSVVFTSSSGVQVTPANPPVSGAGVRMMWYPEKAAFRSGYISGTQWDKDNVGYYSFATGQSTTASGNNSVAMGSLSTASGAAALAIGEFNTAGGDRSIALGYGSVAVGYASTAIGFGARAESNYSMSIGSNSKSIGGGSFSFGDNAIATGNAAVSIGLYTRARSDNSFVAGKYNDSTGLNRLFEIGNGTADNSRKNALTILQNGNTGVNTALPLAMLHVADSSVLFSASNVLPGIPAPPPVSGSGNRTFWYADKAAFRTGGVSGNYWDKDNIGLMSLAAGFSSQASGTTSFATGNFAFATGDISAAIGNSIFAKAKSSFTVGAYNDITDNPNGVSEASSDRIFQVGNGNDNLSRSNAITVLRNGNTGIGTISPGVRLEVVGPASPTPVRIVIANRGGFGPSGLEFVSDYGISSQWRPGYIRSNDIGSFTGSLEFYTNGTGSSNLYGSVKGLEVRNGVTYTATGTVSSFSDARLKRDVQPFTQGMDVIKRITPVSYYYNELSPFPASNRQIGVLAQDLEKIAPYMVDKSYGSGLQDLRSVNNQAYTFLLINAVKELEQKVEEQQKQIDALILLLKQNK